MTNRQITMEIPEKLLLASKTDARSFGRELRVLAAVKPYELGRLSSSQAAELTSVSRVQFVLTLGLHRAFPFESELQNLGQGKCLVPSPTPLLSSTFTRPGTAEGL